MRPSIESPQDYVTTNIQGTLNLLEAAREYPPDNFVFTSSSSVYGDGGSKPFSEDHTPSDRPVSPYAATKKAGELLCHTYHHLHHLNINIVRPFTVYGPRGRPDMAPWKFLSAALEGRPIVQYGDGNTARDYTFIDDFVAGYVAALDNVLGFEIFNLGNAQAVTLKDLLRTLAVVTGRELNVICEGMQSGDVAATLSNNEKASRLLGYSPNVSIANGMRRFLEWYWQSFSATTDKSNHSLLRRAG